MNRILRAGRARRRAGLATLFAVFLSSLSCTDARTLAPIAAGQARLALAPRFAEVVAGLPAVTLSRIDAYLVSPSSDTTFATSTFSGDSASIRFEVGLRESPETFILDLTGFDLDGVEAYHARQEYQLFEGDNSGLEPPVLVYSAPDANVSELRLSSSTVALDLTDTTTLTVSGIADDREISPVRVGWTSTNPEVVQIDATGRLRAGAAPGTAYVVARAMNGLADSAFVTVRQIPRRITVTAGRTSLPAGLSTRATAHVYDARDAEIPAPSVTWRSSDAAVATVSSTGLITAVNVGTATITATIESLTGSVQIAVTGGVNGRVIDGVTGAAIAGATVTAGGNTSVTTSTDGTFVLGGVAAHATLTISAAGYLSTSYFDVPSPSSAVGVIPLVPSSEAYGGLGGKVTDAVTAASVHGAVLTVRAGANATTAQPVLQITTDSGGAYIARLPAGTYTATIAATGYVTTSATIVVVGSQAKTLNFTATPAGSGNTIRIVLTWGAVPYDLDSHLWIPYGGDSLEVAYYSRTVIGADSTTVLGTLDQDRIDGFGPETITVPAQDTGTYHYFVHHFSGESTISLTGAIVKVYRGTTQIAQIAAPTGACGVGDVWTVFDLNGSTLSTINEITCGPPSSQDAGSAGQSSANAIRRAVTLHPKALSPTRVRRP